MGDKDDAKRTYELDADQKAALVDGVAKRHAEGSSGVRQRDDAPRKYELDDQQKMSLAERMAVRHAKGRSDVRGRESKAVFLRLQSEIEEALQFWSVRAVHQELQHEGKWPWHYNRFLRLCKQAGLESRVTGRGTAEPGAEDASTKQQAPPAPQTKRGANDPPPRPPVFVETDTPDENSLVGDPNEDG